MQEIYYESLKKYGYIMQNTVNKVFILGHVSADPKGISFKDGSMITNFSVETMDSWKNKNGTKQEDIQLHNIVVDGKIADIILRHIKKGSNVYIEGSLKTRRYNNLNNQTIYIKEIHAHVFQDLDYNQ